MSNGKINVNSEVLEASEHLEKIAKGEILSEKQIMEEMRKREEAAAQRLTRLTSFIYEEGAPFYVPMEVFQHIMAVLQAEEQIAYFKHLQKVSKTRKGLVEGSEVLEASIPAESVQWLPTLLATHAEDTKEVRYQIESLPEGQGLHISDPIYFYTESGVQAFIAFNAINDIHEQNITEGIAFPASKGGEASGKVGEAEVEISE